MVPFEHQQKEAAYAVAKRVVEAIGGLRGYVGVDMILSGERIFVVDVNARLTTSFVGLRKVAGFNVAMALVEAVVSGELPQKVENKGVVCFMKVQTPKPTLQTFLDNAKSSAVVSPPFPIDSEGYAMVLGDGETPQTASQSLEEAKKHLCT
jgi:predicted ATP-grasp superfamily ATP-dependent carboligase